MVYLLTMVIFHGELLNNQRVGIYQSLLRNHQFAGPSLMTFKQFEQVQSPLPKARPTPLGALAGATRVVTQSFMIAEVDGP